MNIEIANKIFKNYKEIFKYSLKNMEYAGCINIFKKNIEEKGKLYNLLKSNSIDFSNNIILYSDKTVYDIDNKILYLDKKDKIYNVEYAIMYKVFLKISKKIDIAPAVNLFLLLQKLNLVDNITDDVIYSETLEERISALTKNFIEYNE